MKNLMNLSLSAMLFAGSALFANPIHKAIRKGDIEKLTQLLKDKKIRDSINKVNCWNKTPLYLAVDKDNSDMVKLLLENGAQGSINTSNSPYFQYFRPLDKAAEHNNLVIMKLLLQNGAKASIDEGKGSPLEWALLYKNVEMVKLLLFFGAQVTDHVTDKVQKLNLSDDTIKKLIENPKDVKEYCSNEELTEFKEILKKSMETKEKSCNHEFNFLKDQQMLEWDFDCALNFQQNLINKRKLSCLN